MWLDSQGRLFGKLNLVDLLISLFLLSTGGVVAYAVGVSRYQALEITHVEPKRIVAGPRQFVVVRGTGFDPPTTLRLGEHISRGGVYWEESVLGIEINEEVEPGFYALWLRDGRGRTATTPDPLEVVWEPKISEVKPKIIYSTGEGAHLDIVGSFFSPLCTIHLGEREIPAEKHSSAPSRHLSADFSKGPPLPPGQHRLTVTNAGGQSATWEEMVTVVPAPEITSVAPEWIVLGDTVDLLLYGKHFREGSILWLSEELIGEATRVSPNCLKIRLKTNPKMAGRACDVFLEPRDGPRTKVGGSIVYISAVCPAFMVATILLDEESARTMWEFRDSLEWKLRRPLSPELQQKFSGERRQDRRELRQKHSSKLRRNYNLGLPPVLIGDREYILEFLPIIDVLLPAQITREEGALITSALARPLSQGKRIWFKINGQELSGILISKPFAVFSDDYFENKRTK